MGLPESHLHAFIPIQRQEGCTLSLQYLGLSLLLSHLEPSYSNCCWMFVGCFIVSLTHMTVGSFSCPRPACLGLYH